MRAVVLDCRRDFDRHAFDIGLRTTACDFGRRSRCRSLLLSRLMVLLRLRTLLLHDNRLVVELAVLVTIIAVVALVALIAFLHLRLGGCDDAVIVFGVLEIVLRHHPVAGALCVAGKSGVFFRDMLGSTANFHIRTGTVIAAG